MATGTENEKGVRLQKAMAHAGVASRRRCEQMIEDGLVRVNGELVTQPGLCLMPGHDRLEVEGKTIIWDEGQQQEVWILYKPKQCVTTLNDPEGRPTIREFYPRTKARLFPIGRLDYDAEGLLLLTNDGELANRVAHPAFSVEKTYLVKVKGIVTEETLAVLRKGPVVDGKKKQPVRARVLHHHNDKTWTEVVLREGVQHHIKKMFGKLKHRVLKIKRFQVGPISLEAMEPGESRKLSQDEVQSLLNATGGKAPKSGKSRQPVTT